MWETLAAPHPRDILKAEHHRQLKGYPHDVALEKWGPEIEDVIPRGTWRQQKVRNIAGETCHR
jgi:hypothetical protein